MKHAPILTILIVGVICGFGSQSCAGEEPPSFKHVWIMSPQICRGKPWSSTAKTAGWEFIEESKVCRATAGDRPMVASVNPMERGRFIVNVSLQMRNDATLQLFLDEVAFNLSDHGQTIGVVGGPDFLKFHVERTEDQPWSLLRIAREQETLAVTLNGKEVVRFDDKGRSYEQIGLKPIHGTTEVKIFTVTGNVHKERRRQDR